MKHMKDTHKDFYSAQAGSPGEEPKKIVPIGRDNEVDAGLAMVPPGMLEALDARVSEKIQAAIVAERPQVAAAVKGAIEQVIAQARKAGIPIPGVIGKEGGVIPGSPVTSEGAELIKLMFGGGSTDMETLAKTLTQARAISDVLNPPTVWDRVMQNAVLRSLSKAGLVTEAELKDLTAKPPKES